MYTLPYMVTYCILYKGWFGISINLKFAFLLTRHRLGSEKVATCLEKKEVLIFDAKNQNEGCFDGTLCCCGAHPLR